MNKIPDDYRKAIEKINADGENYANNSMLSVYKDQKKALDTVHTFIAMIFLKYATDGLLKLSSAIKTTIMAQFDSLIKKTGKDLGKNEIKQVTNILTSAYQDTFYKNIYTMDKFFDVNLKFNILKPEFIDAAVNTKLDGELFSDRIWSNKTDLVNRLHQELVDISKGNTTIDKAGQNIKNIFNVTANQSKRLLITELTRTQAQAQNDVAINTGVKKHMWSATLDTHTCDECAELDNKIFDIDDDSSPEMPLHPNDRCCWINISNDDWKPTTRKDNETKDYTDYQSYSDWVNNKNISDDEE